MTESGTRDTYAIDHYEVVLDRPGRTIRAVLEHPAIDVTWSRYAAGQRGPDLHVHRSHVDAFYILEGELQFKLGAHASPAHAPAGTFVLVPPNVPHTFNNESTSAAQWLNIHSPSSGFLAYIRGDRTRFDQHDPPADGGPTRLDAIVRRGRAGELIERDNHKLALLGHHPQLSATEIRIDAGFTSDPRAAGHHVDYFFALEGEIEFSVGDSRLRAGPGTWTTVPLGVPAGFGTSVRAPRGCWPSVRPEPTTFATPSSVSLEILNLDNDRSASEPPPSTGHTSCACSARRADRGSSSR